MSDEQPIRATVVIPTCDGGPLLAEVARAVLEQEVPWPFELLVIDSSSTDGSLACLEETPARILTLPRTAFNHGETRNQAARAARGEFVVFLVQDATPIGRQWLRRLVEGLELYPGAVGGYARQRARPDADLPLRRRIEAWTPAGRAPVIKRTTPEAWRRLSPHERLRLAAFDNVCSVVRRQHLLAHPFPALEFGEDVCWGEEQLLAGHALLYIPMAEVWHSHRRGYWEHLRRAQVEHALLMRRFGLVAVPGLRALALQSLGVVASGVRRGPRGVGRQLAELAGQYLAARSGRRRPPFSH
jgi:rhamnosyltransferase